MTTAEQYVKLPRHAQETISDLRRRLESAEKEIVELKHELSGDTEGSKVTYSRLTDDARPLPDHAYIEFKVGYGLVGVMLRTERGGSEYLDISGDSTLRVTPRAMNSLTIDHIPR